MDMGGGGVGTGVGPPDGGANVGRGVGDVQNFGLFIGVAEHEPATPAEARESSMFHGASFGKHPGSGLCPPLL